MKRGELLASIALSCTSLAGLIISILELPSNPPPTLDLLLAFFASLAIGGAITIASLRAAKHNGKEKGGSGNREEQKLRRTFPRIYAFLDSIDSIGGASDFQKLERELNELIEIEKRSRSIRWKELQDIEAIRGIALAKLVSKKNSSSRG